MRRTYIVLIGILVVLAGVGLALRSRQSTAPPQAGSAGMARTGAPMGGPMGGPPGNSQQLAEFEKSHKYAFQLMKLVGSVGRLQESGKAPIAPKQAKSILAILDPVRELEELDEPTARKALIALQGALTDDQRTAISALPPEPKFREGPPPGPRPGGSPTGPPPGAPGRERGFNPLKAHPGGPGERDHPDPTQRLLDTLRSKCKAG